MIATKLMLPVTMVGSMMITALGAGAVYSKTATKLEAAENALREQNASIEKIKEQRSNDSERLTRVEVKVDYTNQMLDKIDKKLK